MTSPFTPSNPFAVSTRFLLLAMLVLAIICAFAFQGSRGLYESTEGRYAECAREMIASSNYLEPTLEGEPHWTKPPLTYWSIALGLKMFGINAWGARIYLSIAFVLTVFIMYELGRTLWDERTGLFAGFIYLSSILPIAAAHTVSTDMLLTLWITLAILGYFKAFREQYRRRQFGWIILMWLAWALAFLTKGPPSLLPLLPLIIWHCLQRQRPFVFHPLGLAVFILGGLSWYIIVCLRNEGLLSYYLGREVVGRVLSEEDRHPEWYKPFMLYLPALTVGAGFWCVSVFKMFAQKDLFDPVAIWKHIRRAGFPGFLLLWLLLPLIVFFLAKSRVIFYVLPLYAPVVLATARWIALQKNPAWIRRGLIYAALTVLITVGAKASITHITSKKDMEQVYRLLENFRSENPEYYLVEQEHNYGLQFYLSGKMKRANLGDKRSWADTKVKRSLESLKANATSRPHAYIVSQKRTGKFLERLSDAGLPHRKLENEYWVVYLVKPAAK